MRAIPPSQPLSGPPALFGPAVIIAGGPYNGLKGNVAKSCDTWGSVVIDFEHQWHEVVTELRFLRPLQPAA